MRERIALGLPGVSWGRESMFAIMQCSQEHEIQFVFSDMPAHNFNNCWATALNLAEDGQATKFLMLHSDTFPEEWWGDTLIREGKEGGFSLVSVAIAIKDFRGLYSCGVGNPDSPWTPKRRFTIREAAAEFPETWTIEDAGYPGEMLLHNNGCWMADLTDKRFFETDEDGYLKLAFNFPCRIYRGMDGKFATDGESEDWLFSRKLWEMGIRNTAITRKVKLLHKGSVNFPNYVVEPDQIQRQRRDWDLKDVWQKEKALERVG